jgi:hypothetical protein
LDVERAGLSFSAEADFGGGPPATFTGLTFGLEVQGSIMTLESSIEFDTAGLVVAQIWIYIFF